MSNRAVGVAIAVALAVANPAASTVAAAQPQTGRAGGIVSETSLFEEATQLIVRILRGPETLANMSNRNRLTGLVDRIADDAGKMADIKDRVLTDRAPCPSSPSPSPARKLQDALDDMTTGIEDLRKVSYLSVDEQKRLGKTIEGLRNLRNDKRYVIHKISMCIDPMNFTAELRAGADAASKMSADLHVLTAGLRS